MFKYDKAAILHVLDVVENIVNDNLEDYYDVTSDREQSDQTCKQCDTSDFTDIPFEKMRLEMPESWWNDDNDT